MATSQPFPVDAFPKHGIAYGPFLTTTSISLTPRRSSICRFLDAMCGDAGAGRA